MGITGVNFAVAETGTIVLISNEGNIRLTTSLPKVHIAVMGIEKVIPKLADLPYFLKVLARAATGQKLSVYTSMNTGARHTGLNASLRDFARFGWLYLNRGSRNGRQIVPEAWVEASVTPDAPHLMPGDDPNSSNGMGYGYQWWIPAGSDGDFTALGIYGQNIYVDPKHRLVIVKNSVDPDFQKNGFENGRIALALWRAIAADLNAKR